MHDENYLIKSDTLEDIADAIREKTGSQDTIAVSDFASEIENIPSGGGDLDWSAIGYESTPQEIVDGYDYALQIQNEWTSSSQLSDYKDILICPFVDISTKTSLSMFAYNCARLIEIPQFNTSNVTNMNNMFYGCTSLKTIPLLNTSNVTDMNNMFQGCSNLTSVPQFNTINVTNVANMFKNCKLLTSVPLFDTRNVTSFNSTFYSCSSLTTIPQFNTSSVENTGYTFNGCSSLVSIPQIDTSKVTDMPYMFNGCSNLETLPQLDTSKVTNMANMFQGCTSLTDQSLTNLLAMCINATSYTGTKTLAQLGYKRTTMPSSRIQALSNYQDFIDAGWTIGY